LQRAAQGSQEAAERLAAELRERDRRDKTRTVSPLMAAEDATVIDSSNMSIDEVVARAEELVAAKKSKQS